jgi:hypothetical protein
MTGFDLQEVEKFVSDSFLKGGVVPRSVEFRSFPGEVIVIVNVADDYYLDALRVADSIDFPEEFDGFVTVKKVAGNKNEENRKKLRIESIHDTRITKLIEILNSKSRTSEAQPSLHYVKDVQENLSVCLTHRHHLIFGRRGVGKTALLVEAKRQAEAMGDECFWINLQTLSGLSAVDCFLTTVDRLCKIPDKVFFDRLSKPASCVQAGKVSKKIESVLSIRNDDDEKLRQARLIASETQELFSLFGKESQAHLYLFFDDIHYLGRSTLPDYLDLIHSVTRDTQCWIKAAGIKHQARWWSDNPPTGLQTGHDAAIIDLDITLERPDKAKELLVKILNGYVEEAGIPTIRSFLSAPAEDRLVLASGGVPRDFLVLTASAIQSARGRSNARYAGVQDVNEAAGQLQKTKIQEVEDDAAADVKEASHVIDALKILRDFLIDEAQSSYFRVDFRDKEKYSKEYGLLQSLMDLRLVHLLNSSLSDEKEAGRRSEVYMLDLSQFSGSRLKQRLRVLDLVKGNLVSKRTRSKEKERIGDTSRRLQGILRRGPRLPLTKFGSILNQAGAIRVNGGEVG